ncbi:uncharacterized protein [Nerophis lumbriciformis]|uniref:uncharacterized protein isoform X1 n=2 Tax=Nerophis lumbriciformis TaxID=546530 RepID=UPI003BAABD90
MKCFPPPHTRQAADGPGVGYGKNNEVLQQGIFPESGGMSNRDSLGFGELIPHDVVEIFAQEKHSIKGRKKRSHSLGRALGWLKGKKRKDLRAKGQNPGLGPALDLALDGHVAAHPSGNKGGHKSGRSSQTQGNSHAALNLHEDDKTSPPPLLQENVFIEGSRPKYLEDLHSEALEGLKMMRQEETNTGVDFQDNESTISMMTVQTDGEGGGFTSDSTIPDAASVKSSVSLRSSRSGLTRQESTFRPLSSGKPSEKGRTRRRRRKTTGIPQHVQRELGLDRMPSKFEREEGFNDECDSDHQGPLSVEQMTTNASHVDDLALLQRLGPDLLDGQRPQSVAFPSMTTANSLQQEMPSPVMLISPQATYMSKIIPNAVLPPSIEVVEISRGQSRNSLRTVSKSSLLLSSPSPSRTSCRTTSSKASKGTYSSHHNPYNLSDTSCWSHSESSETLVSDSSTISSGNASRKDNSHDNETSSKVTFNGNLRNKENEGKRDGHFRSLSIMKPKRAPPPPSRSYSLHNKMKRRSRDLAEAVDILKESSPQSVSASTGGNDEPEASPVTTMDSPGYNGDTSSLEDSTGSVLFNLSKLQQASDSSKAGKIISSSQGKREPLQDSSKIISPSSGYSSQDCTSPQLQPVSSSPKHKRGILAKLQRLFPSSSAPSPLSQSETHENSKSMKDKMSQQDNVESASVSPSVRTLRELFDIPPHPKVHAPPAPPPEVWAHNKRTFELLLGPPAPDNVYAIIKKNPKDRRQQRPSPCVSTSVSTEGSVRSLAGERKGNNQTVGAMAGIAHALETQKVEESALLNANEVHQISNERLTQKVDLEGNGNVNENDENVRVNDILNGMLVKAVEKREERLAAKRDKDTMSSTQSSEVKTKVDVVHAISLIRSTPSPSPPPAHLPPEPPGRQVNNAVSYDSSWPPPPPPIIQVVSVPDERDFPLPPPPLISEGGLIAPLPASPPKSVPAAMIITELHSSSTTPSVVVVTEPELQGSGTSHVVAPPPPSSIPPPPSYTAPPPPSYAAPPPPVTVVTLPTITEVISPPSKDVSSPKPKKGSPPPSREVTAVIAKAPLVQMLHSAITRNISPPLVKAKEDPSTEVAETISVQCSEVVAPAYSQESCSLSPEEETPVSNLYPPQSIPPPPPPIEPLKLLQRSLEAKMALQHETISSESQSEQISCNTILTSPQSVPPPPSLEPLPAFKAAPPNTDEVPANETLPSLQNEAIIPSSPEKPEELTCSPPNGIPVPPPLPMGGLDSLLHPTSPVSTAKKSPEPSSPVQEESLRVVTPSLLQMVKLRPVKSSPEPPIAEEPAKDKDFLTIQQLNDQVQTTLPISEAPQKPIRRSLIILTPSPTATSPPASLPTPPQSQSVVVPPAPTVLKSPVITSPPSMNLQEAIRMRTAARSKDSSAPRLSFQLPTSPKDACHSPTSTANFIFSKNNKRVVIETKPQGDISTTEINETELIKKVKRPPPVAKKPKTKAMDAEGSDAAQPESIMDSAEKRHDSATGIAEGET